VQFNLKFTCKNDTTIRNLTEVIRAFSFAQTHNSFVWHQFRVRPKHDAGCVRGGGRRGAQRRFRLAPSHHAYIEAKAQHREYMQVGVVAHAGECLKVGVRVSSARRSGLLGAS
jgi:hypothetical protein